MGWLERSLCAGWMTVVAGCGPWLTPIPTYWDASDVRVRGGATATPVVTIEATPTFPEATEEAIAAPLPVACTAVYLVSEERKLLAYHPDDGAIDERGMLACPAAFGTPSSMAVGRDGLARVLYTSGELFEVDLGDASCRRLPYDAAAAPYFRRFGMGYGKDENGREALFVAEISRVAPSRGLARIEPASGAIEVLGRFSENPGYGIELTPGENGALYGFFVDAPGPGGTLVKIDPASAAIEASWKVPVGHFDAAFAVAWWRSDFYLFTSQRHNRQVTDIHRYDLKRGRAERAGELHLQVVGASVSTCAPSRQASVVH
jgi:hypothetical protein